PQRTGSDLAAMNSTLLFEQAFGYIVNTSTMGLGAVTTVDLSPETLSDIFSGDYDDWSAVPSGTNNAPVTTVSTNIVLCNREPGSGTRTGTAIFLEGQSGCSPSPKLLTSTGHCAPNNPNNNCFTTSDEIACVTAAAGSIGYVSIDNFAASKISAPVVPV